MDKFPKTGMGITPESLKMRGVEKSAMLQTLSY